MKMARASGIVAVLSLAPAAAVAADHAGPRADVVAYETVWEGHFSGGRNLAPGAEPIPLDWIDVKERFATLDACVDWRRNLSRAYATYEGFQTCVRIR